MATNFRVKKWAISADSPSFVALAFLNGVEYRNYDFKTFICDDLATLSKNFVNFGPATPEFKKSKNRSAVWLRSATARPCGDQY